MKIKTEYLWMPDAYEQLNRLRGTESKYKPWWMPNKLVAYLYMTLLFNIYMLTSFTLSWELFLADFIGNYLIFQIAGWGKYWAHDKNTYDETEFFLSDWYANWKVGKYDKNSTIEFGKKWKTAALKMRFGSTITAKFCILGYLLSDFITPIVGLLFGHKIGNMYTEEFASKDESYAVISAEYRAGKFLGQLMLVPVAVAIGKMIWTMLT